MAFTPPSPDDIVEPPKDSGYQFTPPSPEDAVDADAGNPNPPPRYTSVDSDTQNKLTQLSRTAGVPEDVIQAPPPSGMFKNYSQVGELTKGLNTPLAEVLPVASTVVQHVKGLLSLGESESAPTATRVLSGLAKGIINVAEGFTTPLGIATFGMGALPTSVQRAISAGFAVQMASNLPTQFKQLQEAVKSKDPAAIAETVTDTGLGAAFTAFAATHALTDPSIPAKNAEQQAYRDQFWKDQAAKKSVPIDPITGKGPEFRFTPPEPEAEVPPTENKEVQNAVQVGKATPVPVGQAPENSGEVGARIPQPEKPADAQTEVPPIVPPQETQPAPVDVVQPIPAAQRLEQLKAIPESERTPEQVAEFNQLNAGSNQNNSRAAFEALAKKSGTVLPTKEKPTSSAIRDVDTGEVWSGQPTHGQLHDQIPNINSRNLEAGFMSNKGRFLTQDETEKLTGYSSGEELFVMTAKERKAWKEAQEEVRRHAAKTSETPTPAPPAQETPTPKPVVLTKPPLDESGRSFAKPETIAKNGWVYVKRGADGSIDISKSGNLSKQKGNKFYVGGEDNIKAHSLVDFSFGKAEYMTVEQLRDAGFVPDPKREGRFIQKPPEGGTPATKPLTPMQKAYQEIKAQHPNELVLIRLGDFYEAFWDDAKTLADKAKIALTKRNEVPMAGVPFHAVHSYISKLESQGIKVALVEDFRNYKKPPEEGGPKVPVEPPVKPTTPAAGQKYRIGNNPQLYDLLERLDQSPTEKMNGEQPVRVKNTRTGEVQTVLEQDLTPVKERTEAEKSKPSLSLDDQLRAFKLDPTAFPDRASKEAALKRAKAIGGTGRLRGKIKPSEPQFALKEGETFPEAQVKEGSAKGQDIRPFLNDPERGYDPKLVGVANYILDRLQKYGFDLSHLTLSVEQKLPYNSRGLTTVSDGLIRLAGAADPTTFPHEVFHDLYDLLPQERRQDLNTYRMAELKAIFGDNIPPELASGTMTTEQFLKRFTDADQQQQLYHLINNSEFLSDFAGREAVTDFEKANDPSKWSQFKDMIRQAIRAIVQAVRRNLNLRYDTRQIFDELLKNQWKTNPDSGALFDKEQAQAPQKLPQYEKEKAFETPADLVSQRTIGTYGDVVDMKNKAADAIGASPKARMLAQIPRQELLTAVASGDSHIPRVLMENYSTVRKLTERAGPGMRWSIIRDAWQGVTDEIKRMADTALKFQKQDDLVRSPKFQQKLKQVWDRNLEAQSAAATLETYKNQIAQSAGDVIKELNEKGKTQAQYDQLRADLDRLQKMPEYGEAVRQRVDDMVNVLMSTDAGMNELMRSTKEFPPATARGLNPELASVRKSKSADSLYRTYLDIKEATANKPKAGMAGMVDPQYLSPADRAKLEAANAPALNSDQKAFAQLAAQVLAANEQLRLQLGTLAYFKENPEFQAKVTAVGEKFRTQFEKDPNLAISQLVKTTEKLTGKALTAEQAWLTLNKDVQKQLTQWSDYKDATAIDQTVVNSDEWKAHVNQITTDAAGINVPPSELANGVRPDNVFNEFTGKRQERSPNGGVYDINLGYTKESAAAAQQMMQAYIGDVRDWLNDPKNANDPYRKYWEMRADFVDSVLNVSTALNPSTTEALLLKRSFGIPEFFFKGASIPQAKVAFTASSNFARAWVVGDQWYNKAQPIMLFWLRKGFESHNEPRSVIRRAGDFGKEMLGIDPGLKYTSQNVKDYQRDVLDRLASEYRHGNALKAGDRLNNGIVLTPADIKAFEVQGQFVNELMTVQKNIAREKVMADNILVDEWAKGAFGLRAPQELGARKGTTLPHEFSARAVSLARRLHQEVPAGDLNKFQNLIESEDNFNEFVKRLVAERRADYSTHTPFEEIYKSLAEKWKNNDPDAPSDINGIVDYIDANTTGDYEPPAIRKAFLSEMEGQLRKFYKDHVGGQEEVAKDLQLQRVEKATAFSRAYQRDVGSSFYYDYGRVTAPEIRSMMVDSTNYHLVRLVRAMDALVTGYTDAMARMENVAKSGQKKFAANAMADFRSGKDFRNWERLVKERAEAQYFLKSLPQAYGGAYVPTMDLFSNFQRFTGDAVSAALSGLGTLSNVSFGSPVKMALVLGGMERSRAYTYARATWNTIVSLSNYLYRTPFAVGKAIKGAYNSPEATLRGKLGHLWYNGMTDITEGLFRQSRYFSDQYQFGLGFSNPVGYRIANILADPYTHGLGYNAHLTDKPVLATAQRLGYRMLSAAEAPLELLKSFFPQLGYVASYDAAARTGGTTIDMISSQARRSFDYMEKTGKLDMFDLSDVKSPKNRDIPPDMILPRSLFFDKTANGVNAARDWWSRAIDVPLNETVLQYWKKLSETKPEDRDKVSFLAADQTDAAKVKQVEDARAAGLLSVLVKDVHHASPENRPMELRRNQLVRALFPIAGWFLHSSRGTAQYLGKASTDAFNTQSKLKLMAAAGVISALGVAIVGGEEEKELKKALAKLFYHEETPTKMVWNAADPKEAAQIVAVDATSFIPMAHDMFSTMVGAQRGGEGGGPGQAVKVFTLDKINSLFQYYKGVMATGDPTYGLANLMKVELPISKVFINQMASQQGLIAARNARVLVNLYGPEELTGKETSGAMHLPTPLTPFKQDLQNAIFSNDAQGTEIAAKAFIDKAQSMGKSPEEAQKLLNQALDSFNPLKAGGQKMTDQQMADFRAKLSPQQLGIVDATAKSWQTAASSLGRDESVVKQDRAGGGLGISGGSTRESSSVGGHIRSSLGRSGGRLRGISSGVSSSRSSGSRVKAPRLRRAASHYKGGRTNRLRSHHKKSGITA